MEMAAQVKNRPGMRSFGPLMWWWTGESGEGIIIRDETCEEVVVPCGGFALQAHGAFCGGVSHQVARHVFYRGEVGGSVILADAAFVVAETMSITQWRLFSTAQ